MNNSIPVRFGVIKSNVPDGGCMGKEDRKQMVFDLLNESAFALPPSAIFRNLKLRGATFEERSVKTYLDEMSEEGRVTRIDKEALESGRLVRADDDARAYFMSHEAIERSQYDLNERDDAE